MSNQNVYLNKEGWCGLGHVTRKRDEKNKQKKTVEKPDRKRLFGRLSRRWEDNIKEVQCDCVV